MAQRFLTNPDDKGVGYPVIGGNSVQFSVGDAVYIDTSGWLAIATTSSRIIGYCLEDITMSATNQTVAKVCPKYTPADEVLMVYTGAAAGTQTMIGEYVDFSTVTTGAQVVNTSSTSSSSGQFLILGVDPAGDGTTTDIVVTLGENQKFDYAQP